MIGVHIFAMIAAFAGSFATAGSRAASSAARVVFASVSEAVILVGRTLNSSESMIAVPRVPPIWRKKVLELVATPMSCGSAAAWTAMVRVCISWPRPAPITNIAIARYQYGLSGVMKVRIRKPPAVVAVPVIGKAAYLPVRATSWPVPTEASIRPNIIGRVAKPDWVGEKPSTICR